MKPKVYIAYPDEAVGSIQSYVPAYDCNGSSGFLYRLICHRQPTTRMTLKRSRRRNLDVNGVAGVSAFAV